MKLKLYSKDKLLEKRWGLVLIYLFFSGCSTISVNQYSISLENINSLQAFNGKLINVGPFSSTNPGEYKIMCRAFGPIKTPDGEPFSTFIRRALIDELKSANMFSKTAPVILNGNLDQIDFDSMKGSWSLVLTIKSSNGRVTSVSEHYLFETGFFPNYGCHETALAFTSAVRNLIGKLIRSSDFNSLISE